MTWTEAHVPVGEMLGGIDHDRTHRIGVPFRVRASIDNSSQFVVTDDFPLECCDASNWNEDGDDQEVSEALNGIGVSYTADDEVNTSDAVDTPILPVSG
jgi:hypothetical protein